MVVRMFKITPRERTAAVVGVVIWAVWFIGVSILMSMAVHDQETSDPFFSPFFRWVGFGPFFTFMFVGRYIMRFDAKMASGSLSNTSNAVTSATSFMAWGLVLLVWDCFFGNIPVVPALVLGLALTYLVLVASNRRWNM
ncbi:MAG: hypothetical protein MIO90_05475 [Methanomassiliicoccales archaeon]|nr:hypothetical protein [Methanomassiliicoccales archaeon]